LIVKTLEVLVIVDLKIGGSVWVKHVHVLPQLIQVYLLLLWCSVDRFQMGVISRHIIFVFFILICLLLNMPFLKTLPILVLLAEVAAVFIFNSHEPIQFKIGCFIGKNFMN
jgi:hypothetical protein